MSEPDIPIFLAGLAAAFAVLHVLLFAFFRRADGNLLYSFFATCQVGFFVALATLRRSEGSAEDLAMRTLWTFGIAMCLFALQFELHVFFDRRWSMPHLALALAGIALVVRGWLVPTHQSVQAMNLLAFVVCLEMLRLVMIAIGRGRPDAWIVGAGFAALTLAGLYITANNLGWITGYNPYAFPIGVVGLTLSMSAFLSRRVARSHRNALEQERKAHRAELERQRLAATAERHKAELEQARQLQLAMLPEEPPRPDAVEVAFRMWTASVVGGDYYDYKRGEGGSLTIAVGDATGHGLDSALMVASAKSLFQSGDSTESLPEALGRISRGIKGMKLRRMNVALSMARLTAREVRLAAAGMPPALIYRHRSEEVEEVLLPGPPLGAMSSPRYSERRLELASGDAVLLMSDGLPERADADGEPLGYARTRQLFLQAARRSPAEALEALSAAASDFAGQLPLADDMTLVILKAR